MKDLKREVARMALQYLKPHHTIGLGAGTTISYLAELIHEEIPFRETLKFVTPSAPTSEVLNNYNLPCIDPSLLTKIDIYFDSCDQVDQDFNAFKSGGGIHTKEKLFASMASEFILLVDVSKLVPVLNTDFPICIELFPEASAFVLDHISWLFTDSRVKLRTTKDAGLPLVNNGGNLLADVYFDKIPPLDELNIALKAIPGVVDHSLFYGIATRVLIAENDGTKILNNFI